MNPVPLFFGGFTLIVVGLIGDQISFIGVGISLGWIGISVLK